MARLAVVTSAVIAVGAIRLASDEAVPVLDVAVAALALVSAAVPDSHVGVALIAMIGVDWWVQVDDVASPWAIAVAGAVAVAHASLAASTVAPPTARWTGSMVRRWITRTCLVGASSAVSWLVAAWVDEHPAVRAGWLAGLALAASAIAALWAARSSRSAPTTAGR
jgi:hypothetical protein